MGEVELPRLTGGDAWALKEMPRLGGGVRPFWVCHVGRVRCEMVAMSRPGLFIARFNVDEHGESQASLLISTKETAIDFLNENLGKMN